MLNLHCNVERLGAVVRLNGRGNALHGHVEIGHFSDAQVGKARHHARGRDKNVCSVEGLEHRRFERARETEREREWLDCLRPGTMGLRFTKAVESADR